MKITSRKKKTPVFIYVLFFFLLALSSLFFYLFFAKYNFSQKTYHNPLAVSPSFVETKAPLIVESLTFSSEQTQTTENTPILVFESEENYPVISANDGRTDFSMPLLLRQIPLVNRKHPVNRFYRPPLDAAGLMQPEARKAFDEMTEAAKKDGIVYALRSAYRSFESQYKINQYYLQTDPGGIASVDTYSAPAGASEHQTGLALDLDNGSGLSSDFDQTPAGIWLQENAYKYGFIVRFPKDKQHITGYHYEPWHFRYIGKEAAAVFGPWNSLTLEEYLDAEPAPAPSYPSTKQS